MVKCNFCGKDAILKINVNLWKLYYCKNCEISFLYPLPADIEKIYDDNYFKRWYLPYYKARKLYIEKIYLKLQNFFPKTGKILDIGCGIGIFMDFMSEKKYEIFGYEISQFAIDFCRKRGLKVSKNLNFPKNSFDIITMFDVLAHIPNPVLYLERCKSLLKNNGILIIKTPLHSDYIFFLSKIFSFTRKSKSILHIPAQIYHFNKNSIFKIAKMIGFEIEKVFIIREFVNRNFSIFNLWKFFIEKSIIAVLKNGEKN